MRFSWRHDPPRDVFDAGRSDRWLWPLSGVAVDGTVHLFALRMEATGGGHYDFRIDDVVRLAFPSDSSLPPVAYERRETPLFLQASGDAPETVFGVAIDSSRPGWLHVYGVRNDPGGRELLVARVRPGDLARFDRWRFRSDGGWSADPRQGVALAGRISPELGTAQLDSRGTILVHELDAVSPSVVARRAPGPAERFGPASLLWTCPEAASRPGAYCYNAKPHPGLSGPGELIVSYHVNAAETATPESLAGFYGPRFLRVRPEAIDWNDSVSAGPSPSP